MTDHLTPSLLNALADGELSADQLAVANEHLASCPACTSAALYQSMLKSATERAGHRFAPPPQLEERLARMVRQESAPSKAVALHASTQPVRLLGFAGWATAFVCLLLSGSAFLFERDSHRTTIAASEYAGLVTEVCDQHVATLAANLPPQVVSSDRHTVKPWFQGKIPFSFNLPENLPSDTKLEGANLTYVRNQPAALLLYSIGKHRVSVFVRQRTSAALSYGSSAEYAGFHVARFSNDDLDVIAVSDVDPTRLSNLVSLIEQSQTGTGWPTSHR
jgi:anti-sigma factor RsiW